MHELTVGQPVPDFTLTAANGESVTLSEFRGRHVVLYFYPRNMTPTCTEQACQFRDYSGELGNMNTAVIGISPDPVRSHHKFAAKYELPFPLLSDPDHQVAEQFGVWALKKLYGREYMGIVRSTFLIDKQGRLVREWRKVRMKGHLEEVEQAVRAMEGN
ncbi:thioredoxin-dependent thiol peroxidase [Paenibacillus puerhi]|uniref:thioredoxin-dependent thiol peroxidase n=1 Tax=Paenibacillus puerhi TaxID=2692622 RepID=UPI00135C2E74|nr:thioredoxin-dependent thiol peroxidase [Paenibacillus puerhi]